MKRLSTTFMFPRSAPAKSRAHPAAEKSMAQIVVFGKEKR
jgi:hypothetical protein